MKNLCPLGRLLVAAFAIAPYSTLLAIPVWINEIHYDNASTDVGEFVEIAGAAGTNLSGYSLILYNGSSGSSYNTINLSGILPDDSNGFGISNAISFPTNGLQNGAPDGIALSGPGVLQFLSYEGSFTATDGSANGITSTDIGVAETNSTPVGHSLQLTGLGTEYADFAWTGPTTASPGAINTGQRFPANSVPDNGSSAWLLIFGLSGLAFAKRRKLRFNNK